VSRILLVEDNSGIAEGLRLNLELDGHEVRVAGSGEDALAAADRWPPALVILDLMLPGMDGFGVLTALRGRHADLPVLILSARADEVDRVRGFRLGADDYVVKPFSLAELLARVQAILRRSSRTGPAPAQRFGDITVDLGTHEVHREGAAVALRPKEYELLVALLSREGRVASRAELLEEVWRYEPDVYSRTVDIHMAELRRKLEPDPARPRHLLTVRKTGYRLRREPGAG
jgi:two-component system alkaline phosphatase synthesis response regulator PhoP